MESLNEVIDNGKVEKFHFFIKLENGEYKSMELPIEKKEAFENRFIGDVPDAAEYYNWLGANI